MNTSDTTTPGLKDAKGHIHFDKDKGWMVGETVIDPTTASAQPENVRDWQEAKVSSETSQILAARFYNGSNELIQCYQLISNGRAFAVADFRNGKLERFDCIAARLEESKTWLASLKNLAGFGI